MDAKVPSLQLQKRSKKLEKKEEKMKYHWKHLVVFENHIALGLKDH